MLLLKILIVNTNTAFNEAVRRLLSCLDESAQVHSAGSVNDARHKWRQVLPHIIFLSMEQGYKHLAVAIKQELPETKIIGMLLFNNDLGYYAAKPSLFDGFISKERFNEQALPLIRTAALSDENKEASENVYSPRNSNHP